MTNSPLQAVLSGVPAGPLRDLHKDPPNRPQNLSEPLRAVAPIPVAPLSFSDMNPLPSAMLPILPSLILVDRDSGNTLKYLLRLSCLQRAPSDTIIYYETDSLIIHFPDF